MKKQLYYLLLGLATTACSSDDPAPASLQGRWKHADGTVFTYNLQHALINKGPFLTYDSAYSTFTGSTVRVTGRWAPDTTYHYTRRVDSLYIPDRPQGQMQAYYIAELTDHHLTLRARSHPYPAPPQAPPSPEYSVLEYYYTR